MKKRLTDLELVEMLQAGGRLMEEAARYLLHDKSLQSKVNAFVRSKGGSLEDAEDVYIDGLSQLVINVRNNRFDKKSKLSTYLFSICKYKWYDSFKKKGKEEAIKENMSTAEEVALSPEEVFLLEETYEQLDALLDQLGEDRKRLLALWALGYSYKEIVARTDYKDENVVAKTKSITLHNLKILVLANPYW